MEATKMVSSSPLCSFPSSSDKRSYCLCERRAMSMPMIMKCNNIDKHASDGSYAKVGLKNGVNKRPIRRASATIDGDVGDLQVQAGLTWQVLFGAIAGVTPFVVAGIEFSKRIVAQKRCEVCKGSGLVLRDKYYFRCPGCGGFLPWQSWKRFFTG